MRGGARGRLTSYTPSRETLATTSSQSNSEALAACVVLTHPCAVFHLCMCELRRGTAAIAAALIGYDDQGGCRGDNKEEAIMIDYFLYTDARLR
jgi:hypothetical protein